jgi:hypothetical protein
MYAHLKGFAVSAEKEPLGVGAPSKLAVIIRGPAALAGTSRRRWVVAIEAGKIMSCLFSNRNSVLSNKHQLAWKQSRGTNGASDEKWYASSD